LLLLTVWLLLMFH